MKRVHDDGKCQITIEADEIGEHKDVTLKPGVEPRLVIGVGFDIVKVYIHVCQHCGNEGTADELEIRPCA